MRPLEPILTEFLDKTLLFGGAILAVHRQWLYPFSVCKHGSSSESSGATSRTMIVQSHPLL